VHFWVSPYAHISTTCLRAPSLPNALRSLLRVPSGQHMAAGPGPHAGARCSQRHGRLPVSVMDRASQQHRPQPSSCVQQKTERGPRRDCPTIPDAVLSKITPRTHQAAQPWSTCLFNWGILLCLPRESLEGVFFVLAGKEILWRIQKEKGSFVFWLFSPYNLFFFDFGEINPPSSPILRCT